MKRIIFSSALFLFCLVAFGQKPITAGMTGLQMRNAINGNNDTLYVLTGKTVNTTKSRYSTIQGAINAASSGATIIINQGTYSVDSTALKNGVNLVGIGTVTVQVTGTSATKWALAATNVTCNIEGLTFKGRNTLIARGTSNVTLKNCTFSALPADEATYNSRIQIWDNSVVKAEFCDFVKTSMYFYENSVSEIAGCNFDISSILVDNYANVSIQAERFYSISSGGIVTVGSNNPYEAAIIGNVGAYKDTSDVNYPNYRNYNNTHIPVLYFSARDCSRYYGGTVYAMAGGTLNIRNTCFNNELYKRTIIEARNHANIFCEGVTFSKISGWYGDPIISLKDCLVHYDCDIVPTGDTLDTYNASDWPIYGEGSHCAEMSRFYNSILKPMFKMVNSTLEYMGDDVLNSLPAEQALKEMCVAPNWAKNTTTPLDASTISGSPNWVTATLYHVGDLVYQGNKLYYVVIEHTSGVFQTDWINNRIRMFVAANKNLNGYWKAYYYHKTSGWQKFHELGEWHGGMRRNRGNPIAGYECNLYYEDSKLIRHANFFTWKGAGALAYTNENVICYPQLLSTYIGYDFVMNNISLINVGANLDQGVTGFVIDFYSQFPKKNYIFNNITISGEDIFAAVYITGANAVAGDQGCMQLGNFDLSGSANSTAGGTYLGQYFSVSAMPGKTYQETMNFLVNPYHASFVGGSLKIKSSLDIGANWSMANDIKSPTSPVRLYHDPPNDTLVITFTFSLDLNNTYLYYGYADFNIYAHTYYINDEYAAMFNVKATQIGDGLSGRSDLYKTALFSHPGGGWTAPTTATIGLLGGTSTTMKVYVTSSNATDTWVQVLPLYLNLVTQITITVQ